DQTLVRIGTRGSALALAQAHQMRELLERAHPKLRFEIQIIKTTGDKRQDLSLAKVSQSTKGLFTKELEVALLRRKIDLAVHSLKDLPVELPGGLILGAVPKREDVSDFFISKTEGGLGNLRAGATVATSSLRRKVQLQFARPDLKIVEIRGNVETRILKLCESPDFDAMLLASAGLNRLGYRFTDGKYDANKLPRSETALARAANPFIAAGAEEVYRRVDVVYGEKMSLELMLPAVGQGALGIEIRADDQRIIDIVSRVHHFATAQAVVAERQFLLSLGGGCQVPLAAYALCTEGKIHLKAVVFNEDGTNRRAAEIKGEAKDAEILGKSLAAELK
ncbi:MAG: hydroxymethylbilane synthase, partial [Verrucomicrobiota bacterium]|nr:hydroxymethylbilane synthase [Verrucomicrobiota bacterium]